MKIITEIEKEERKECEYCFEKIQNCVCTWVICAECGKKIPTSIASEYRGRIFCESHNFEEQANKREFERAEVIEENEHQTAPLKGLSFGDSPIGRANRKILKGAIEVAKKETARTRRYEGRDI